MEKVETTNFKLEESQNVKCPLEGEGGGQNWVKFGSCSC